MTTEPVTENVGFRPVSQEWFNKSLQSSSLFGRLGIPERQHVYLQYCD